MHLLCATHTLAPSGALRAQIPTEPEVSSGAQILDVGCIPYRGTSITRKRPPP
jgi:hypothetical protein